MIKGKLAKSNKFKVIDEADLNMKLKKLLSKSDGEKFRLIKGGISSK